MDRSERGRFNVPRPVWLLGWVSLATDAAGEAIYPLLPFFLTQVLGAGAVSLGVVEGAAEAANSLLKVLSGRAADRVKSKRPLVLLGYGISSCARPLVALARSWPHVFAVRVFDRVGKGIRSAPRDAMLATWATPSTRGKVFGLHQAMDHAGAVLGPVLASLFLYLQPGQYRTLFALTAIPGAIAVVLVLFLREGEPVRLKPDAGPGMMAASPATTVVSGVSGPPGGVDVEASGVSRNPSSRSPTDDAPRTDAPLPRQLHAFLGVLALFTLGNSTDAFLLLRLSDVAGTAVYLPLLWAALHIVKASVSVLGGSWSDRIGRRAVIALGWVIYASVYVGFAVADTMLPLVAWFLLYGLYFGLTEGVEKALVADLAPASRRGFAFGLYNAVLGAGGLAASVLFGVLWSAFGSAVAFGTGSALALAAAAMMLCTPVGIIVVPHATDPRYQR